MAAIYPGRLSGSLYSDGIRNELASYSWSVSRPARPHLVWHIPRYLARFRMINNEGGMLVTQLVDSLSLNKQ